MIFSRGQGVFGILQSGFYRSFKSTKLIFRSLPGHYKVPILTQVNLKNQKCCPWTFLENFDQKSCAFLQN